MYPNLGKLETVELREIWKHEAQDFTPWLSKTENLKILSETLNMTLELKSIEESVGNFNADILCKNLRDGSLVLIENQLESTNHTHLGQVITYASGLQTVNIVWIARSFVDEHRGALDWLNEISGSEFRFFGLEIELVKIGNSNPAPKFNIVSQPNDWSKSMIGTAKRARDGDLTPAKKLQKDFWIALKDFASEKKSKLRFQAPRAQSWITLKLGISNTHLLASVNTQNSSIAVGFESDGNTGKAYFDRFEQAKIAIEKELGFAPEWRRLDEKAASKIIVTKEADIWDRDSWPEMHEWLIEKLESFDNVFRKRVKKANITSKDVSSSDE